MKGSGAGNMVMRTILIAVLFGCFISTVHGRSQLRDVGGGKSFPNSHTRISTPDAATTLNSAFIDESKVTLTFCHLRNCKIDHQPCYCCLQTDYCYNTEEECRAKCITCDPKCPPQTTVEG
ncbi:unnamed protein product [Urochloa humidicola]